MIELQHISKRFGPVAALDDVSLAIAPGKILGLLGENGAGKSTLMNILFGLVRADSGVILAGQGAAPGAQRNVRITSPRVAQGLGIGMVHQHFKLVPSLTVLENFSLFLPGPRTELRRRAEALLDRLQWTIPLDRRVDTLAVGGQQRVEILKALLILQQTRKKAGRADAESVLILDEPTAVLTPQETGELFAAMRRLRDAAGEGADGEGTGREDAIGAAGGAPIPSHTAIVFITHKLAEVRKICDEIAILRRGKLVYHGATAELSAEEIAEKMVGSRVAMPGDKHIARLSANRPLEAVLHVRDLSTTILHRVSLYVAAGEILGIAGVDGNGQSQLVQALLGIHNITSGEILLAGLPATGLSTRERLAKIAFIAEDRQSEALVLPLSIRDNLLLKDYRAAPFNTLGWLRYRAWNRQAKELLHEFDIRAASANERVGQLSGGNQQKVVLARELHATNKPVILAVNPTRGLDIGASAFVFQRLLEARQRGAAILLIHSDLDELLAISDRVAVMFNGTLSPTRWPAEGKEAIGRRMLGLKVAV